MTPPLDDPGGGRPRAPGPEDERTVSGSLWRPDAARTKDAPSEDRSAVSAGGDAQGRGQGQGEGGEGSDELAAARRERDEYLDMVRRVQADFENYKKRMIRQQTDLLERAGEALVVKLLPALDAFDLTRAHLESEGDASPETKALLQASELVFDVLSKEGLERIADAGSVFDPTVHDAVEHAPAEDDSTDDGGDGPAPMGEPVVSEVLRPGYRWKGRVIRPAMVKVRG